MDNFIKNLAKAAGKILKEGFRKNSDAKEKKGFWDIVTKYDLMAEQFVIERIKKKYPNHGILTEESGLVRKAKNFWILDPIDGTTNFFNGIANFGIAISYVHKGTLELATIYEPITDELFYAKNKKGAFLNGKEIKVSRRDSLYRAMMVVDLWLQSDAYKYYTRFLKLGIRPPIEIGSSILEEAYTAAGRYDVALLKGGQPWDYSAGGLILKEAGAKVTDFSGNPFRWDFKEICAANPELHKQVMKILEKI